MKTKIIYSTLALLIAAGAGFGFAKIFTPKAATTVATEDNHNAEKAEEHTENEGDEIDITEADAKAAGIETASITFGSGSDARILGQIVSSPEAKIMVGAPIGGRVSRVYVAIGSNVSKGAPLFEIISADGASVIADSRAATANAAAAQKAYASDKWLYAKGVISRRDLETSQANAAVSSSMAGAANAKINAAGNPSANGRIIVRSPINGVVSSMPVTIGGFIPQGSAAGEIYDINNTEAEFKITPDQAGRIQIGSNIVVNTNDGRQLNAKVKAIAPQSDLNGSTSVLRAKILETNLAVGTTLIGRIAIANDKSLRPVVPASAIINLENKPVVFIKTEHGFKAVPIMTGQSYNGVTEIVKGLSGKEIIVTKNAFLLKSELSSSEEHSN